MRIQSQSLKFILHLIWVSWRGFFQLFKQTQVLILSVNMLYLFILFSKRIKKNSSKWERKSTEILSFVFFFSHFYSHFICVDMSTAVCPAIHSTTFLLVPFLPPHPIWLKKLYSGGQKTTVTNNNNNNNRKAALKKTTFSLITSNYSFPWM